VVFPKGALDDAPQFHVLLTRVPSKAASASFQQTVVKTIPQCLHYRPWFCIKRIDDLMDKLGDIIRFMAMFSIITV